MTPKRRDKDRDEHGEDQGSERVRLRRGDTKGNGDRKWMASTPRRRERFCDSLFAAATTPRFPNKMKLKRGGIHPTF